MKKVVLLAAVLIFVFSFSNSYCEKNYEIEKAIVTYRLSGMTTGTMELVFDKYGEYVSTTTETPGAPKSTFIMTPDSNYMINWEEKTALDMSMMGEDMMEDETPGEDVDFENEAKKLGTETILGKNATVYLYEPEEGGRAKYWVWKNIMLKSETEFNGMKSVMEATSLKTPGSIPAKTFEIPSNIKKQKMPSFSLPIPGFGN